MFPSVNSGMKEVSQRGRQVGIEEQWTPYRFVCRPALDGSNTLPCAFQPTCSDVIFCIHKHL